MLSLKKKMLMAGGARLRPQDFFETVLGTAAELDALSTTGQDLLIAKSRVNTTNWSWRDSASGLGNTLASNTTAAQTAFSSYASILGAGNAVLYRLKEKRKAFARVTYTGNGQSGRQIPHGLGDVPGMIVVKARDATRDWGVYHRSRGASKALLLNYTNAESSSVNYWNNTEPTATAFTVGLQGDVNSSGVQYVAYLFAHNQDLIDCGSYVGNGSATGPVVTCGKGWTPQWLMLKRTNAADDWFMYDASRTPTNPRSLTLLANSSAAETSSTAWNLDFTASGFQPRTSTSAVNGNGSSYIYLAIRSPT